MNNKWTHNDYIHYITKKTQGHNLDNISRTKAYQHFYIKHPEIKWSLLASVVSRNAGWNMTDLYLPPFRSILGREERLRLFMTYERANWLIFSDAYPQLLIYMIAKELNQPMFNLLSHFRVSKFMINEWERFWYSRNKRRLVNALIINEQNVIQEPVIDQSYFKKNVFLSLPYLIQNYLLMNAVLVPTMSGEVYGKFIHGFTKLSNRINLGQYIAETIFGESKRYQHILNFLLKIEHTGSRSDYEQFLNIQPFKNPQLRKCYREIKHDDMVRPDWYQRVNVKKIWLHPPKKNKIREIGSSFYRKRRLLNKYYQIKRVFYN